MKATNKNKLTAKDIINFFIEKPTFDKSETDSSLLYGWPSTRNGLYSITDIYKYFEAKGYVHKDVDDVLYKSIQTQSAFSPLHKLEKGKTDTIFTFKITNHNPDYCKSPFSYYLYNITKDEALKLKSEYESESLRLMQTLISKKNSIRSVSVSKANRIKKAKVTKTPRVKKLALSEDFIDA